MNKVRMKNGPHGGHEFHLNNGHPTVVEFLPWSTTDPSLPIFRYEWKGDIDNDVYLLEYVGQATVAEPGSFKVAQ